MLQKNWNSVDERIAAVLRQNDGVAKMKTFLAAGLTNKQVAAAYGRGVLHRPRDAWYSDPTLSWQAEHAIRVGGFLACVSAADSYGLPVPPESRARLHVLLPDNTPRVRHNRDKRHYVVPGEDPEVQPHWSGRIRPICGWRTSVVDALLALVDCVPDDWFVAALHAPWQGAALVSDEEYADFAERLPRRKRRLLAHVDARAGSVLETLLRLALIRRGIGPLTPQFSPDDRRLVDFLVGEWLIVEADGAGFHDPEQDAIRDAFFRSLGYTVLRFSYERIINDLEAVLDEIEAALAASIL